MRKNNKRRFFYVLHSDKTWVFDQSERVLDPIYIVKKYNLAQVYLWPTINYKVDISSELLPSINLYLEALIIICKLN